MSLYCLDCYVFLLTRESFFFFIQILNNQDFYSRNMLALKEPTNHFIQANFSYAKPSRNWQKDLHTF